MRDQAGYATAPTPKEVTLNDRLNGVSERLQGLCDRIEQVLGRVNGTPAPVTPIKGGSTALGQLPLSTVVEHLEGAQSRLHELTSNLERIA